MDGKPCAKCERDATVIVDGVHMCSRCALESLGDRDEAEVRMPGPQPAAGRRMTRSVLDRRTDDSPTHV